MDATTFSKQLNKRMDELGIKQADLVALCQPFCSELNVKLTKKNISQYVNGQFIPRHGKLTAICKALNVDESYFVTGNYNVSLSSDEEALIRCWRLASYKEKQIVAMTLSDHGIIPLSFEEELQA